MHFRPGLIAVTAASYAALGDFLFFAEEALDGNTGLALISGAAFAIFVTSTAAYVRTTLGPWILGSAVHAGVAVALGSSLAFSIAITSFLTAGFDCYRCASAAEIAMMIGEFTLLATAAAALLAPIAGLPARAIVYARRSRTAL